jgi:hypothetical protein
VLEVSIAAGVTEPAHEHRWPSVMRIEVPQPLTGIHYRLEGDRLVETGREEVGAVTTPSVFWIPSEGPHALRNNGTAAFRAFRVELKRAAAATPPRP